MSGSCNTLTEYFFLFIVCSLGHYGMNCRKQCSGHCINNVLCDHVSGECMGGCTDGYIGTSCNNCKTCLQ